jgi:hypothetical protein
MKRNLTVAALAALSLSAITAPPASANPPLRQIRIEHGETIQQAIQRARFTARMDALRAAAPRSDVKDVQPSITSGTIVSTTLTVGVATSIPEVTVGYKTGAAGLVGLSLIFSSPNGNESLSVNYSPQGLSTHGDVTVEQPGNVPYYTQPGQWQLVAAYIEDYAGNFVSYSQSQLATLFATPYITVVNNGPIDITPPVVTSGQILTPTVKLSSPVPVFEATLTGTDDISGIYEPFVAIEAPGATYGLVDEAPMPFPLLSGTGTAYSTLSSGAATGIYTITTYALCDVAGNCFSDQSATDIQNLFGTTTFKVTK